MPQWSETRFLFITANPADGGHRLGRIAACLNNVHWYSHPMNGINPWETPGVVPETPDFLSECVRLSNYHFQRVVGDTYLPHVGERIFRRWANLQDWKEMFLERMELVEDVPEYYIPWVVHTPADVLAELFPTSKIVNLYDETEHHYEIADRYMETTANFPYYFHFHGQNPSTYKTDYTKDLERFVRTQDKDVFTHRDYWWHLNGFNDKWNDILQRKYRREVLHELDKRVKVEGENILNVQWSGVLDDLPWFLLGEFDSHVNQLIID